MLGYKTCNRLKLENLLWQCYTTIMFMLSGEQSAESQLFREDYVNTYG